MVINHNCNGFANYSYWRSNKINGIWAFYDRLETNIGIIPPLSYKLVSCIFEMYKQTPEYKIVNKNMT